MGFVRPYVSILVGMVVSVLAFILQVVGLATPGWFRVRLGLKGETSVGLWEFCYEQPKVTCDDFDTQWTVEAWVEATRAFGILAVLALVACIVTSFFICCLRHVVIFFAIVPWTALVSNLLIFVQLAVFAGEVERRKNTMGQDFRFHYSFIITILSFFLTLLATICFFIGESRHFAAARDSKTLT